MKTVGLIVATTPLVPYKNSTILEDSIRKLKRAEVELIVVVINSNKEQIESLLKNKEVEIVYHPTGSMNDITSLVKAGLQKVFYIQDVEQSEELPFEALFILSGDTPSLNTSVLVKEQLLMKYSDAKILYPTIQGKKKYPPLIRFNILQDIYDYAGEDGLKGALAQFESETAYMEVDEYDSTLEYETSDKYIKL